MIDSSPRPLPQKRLGKLVMGLRERMSGSLQKTADEVDRLSDEIAAHEEKLNENIDQLAQKHRAQTDETTVEWDEALQSCWDQAELDTYKAIFDTAEKEGKRRIAAKAMVGETQAEAKKRVADIERRFLQAKDVPLNRLKNFRAANKQMLDKLLGVEQAAANSLAQRSVGVPKVTIEPQTIDQPKNSNLAFEGLKESIEQAEKQCRHITHNRLANLFDSIWWWGFCAFAFLGISIGLTILEVFPLMNSLLIGAGATVALMVIGWGGVTPLIKRSAAKVYPSLRAAIEQGKLYQAAGEKLAVAENDAELHRLAKRRDDRFQQAKKWQESTIKEIVEKADADIKKLRAKAIESKRSAKQMLTRSTEKTNSRFEGRLGEERTASDGRQAVLRDEHRMQKQTIQERIDELTRNGALRMHIATQKALKIVSRSRRWCQDHFPDWAGFEKPGMWPETLHEPLLPLGTLKMNAVLPDTSRLDVTEAQLAAPVLFSPLEDEYLAITGDPSSPMVQNLVKNLVMRALTALPAGRSQVCIVDPPGLGRDFGWLMHLSDFDPQLVSHRVWTQPGHIAKQLNQLAMSAEDFIQQSLRNQYQDIVAYNQDAGALAEPFRILVWSSLPSGMDEQSWKSLKSILDTGARCGIISILVVDPNMSWPAQEQRDFVYRRGLHVHVAGEEFGFGQHPADEEVDEFRLRIKPAEAAADSLSQEIVQQVGRRALTSNRVEVPLANMLPDSANRWQADSSNLLEIPIGQSGVGRTHSLKLGVGTAQHAIIAGKTGSGKSSLLHAMITSAMMKYSPEALRLVLLDFKKGVEFQVYSDNQVPHADIIGIESHREFGLSALEYVDGCMQRRGEAFRAAGVQDIGSWNAIKPDAMLPRMLIVVDEFQELFVEDDKLSGQASLILDRIVRQGRSFGVHAVLSSQTLAGSYSLPRTTLGQMAVRIALQCDASDAQIIFAEDNPAASRLKHPGQAVYNDAGGRIEGNQPMQIGWLPKQTQLGWFGEMEPGYRNGDETTNRLARTVVYDGNRAATWDNENANLALKLAKEEVNPDANWCVVGESVAINPAVVFPLTLQAGRNILLVGNDDAQAATVMRSICASFVRNAKTQAKPELKLIQAAKPTDAQALALNKQIVPLPAESKIVDQRQAEELITEVHQTLQERLEQDEVAHAPILMTLVQIGRMRDLRKEDDFASFGESELTADKKLEEILRDGPSNGIYTMIWAENYATVNRWLSRTALRETEIRLLMQMSGNDSTNLVDSIAASRLGEHVMLLFDEATGQEQRFRPFATETMQHVDAWANES